MIPFNVPGGSKAGGRQSFPESPCSDLLVEKTNKEVEQATLISAMFGLHCNANPSKATRSLEPWKAGTMTAVKLC